MRKKVAKKLGNTPAVARSSYIDPRVIEAYESDSLSKIRSTVESMKRHKYLNTNEQCVLATLEESK